MAGPREALGLAAALILLTAILPSAVLIAPEIHSDHDGSDVETQHGMAKFQTRSEDFYVLYAWVIANPKKALPGTNVTLDGSNSYGSYDIVNYTWNFTVGLTEVVLYGEIVIYCFTEPENYSVQLTVQDSQGHVSGMAIPLLITYDLQNQPPVAMAWAYGEPWWVNESVFLFGGESSDDCGISSYLWTITGNGTYATLAVDSGSYYFTRTGEYYITLTVTDIYGLNDSESLTIQILDIPELPLAEAGPNQTVSLRQEVWFDGRSSSGGAPIDNWTWSFIDQMPVRVYGFLARYLFNSPGDHLVVLTIRDIYYREATDLMTVHVGEEEYVPPVADAGNDAAIRVGTAYRFDGSRSTGVVSDLGYSWSFTYNGTHQIMYGVRPMFTFSVPGKYLVTLTLTDSLGVTASDSVTITVTEGDPSPPNYVSLLVFEASCAAAVIALVLYWLRLRSK